MLNFKRFDSLVLAGFIAVSSSAFSPAANAQASGCNPNLQCCVNIGTGTPCSTGAGNPINTQTGNKFQQEVDLPALPGVLGLELVRFYNSNASGLHGTRGLFGRGWKLSYETEARLVRGVVRLELADGTVNEYRRVALKQLQEPEKAVYRTVRAEDGRIYQDKDNNLVWVDANGARYSFNSRGLLTQVAVPSGEFTTIQRDSQGKLLSVTDPQGRQLIFQYQSAQSSKGDSGYRGVESVQTPVGIFRYQYGAPAPKELAQFHSALDRRLLAANLFSVSSMHGSQVLTVREYHYEDSRWPTLLTGITVQGDNGNGKLMRQRIRTWGYDAQGRGNLSVLGEPARLVPNASPKRLVANTGIEQITLDYSERKADGSGVTVLTNSLGKTTRYHYEKTKFGIELMAVNGAGCASCGPVDVDYVLDKYGKRQLREDAQLRQFDSRGRLVQEGNRRYEYANDWDVQPSRVSWPSVVPGKQAEFQIQYNAFGQITEMLQIGYSPEKAERVERITRYVYSKVNDRSVLTRIDGPLGNGPKNDSTDSDITEIAWDSTGSRVIALQPPGKERNSFEWDSAGRLQKVSGNVGTQTEFTYNVQGQLVKSLSRAPGWAQSQVQHYRYDALGRETEVLVGENRRPELATGYDVADRQLWKANALGVIQQHQYDTESRLLQEGKHTGAMSQSRTYDYSADGVLVRARDNAGRQWGLLKDAKTGFPGAMEDALGRVHSFSYKAAPLGNARHTNHAVIDDFGQLVKSIFADSGTSSYRYDRAGRLIGMRDALGNEAEYSWTLDGRISSQQWRDAKSGEALTTRWHYQGKHLVRLEHPTQSEYFTYDERGLRTLREVRMQTASGVLHGFTRYDYDANGELISTTLPDASKISLQRNGQGQVIAVTRKRTGDSWSGRLAGEQILAKDFERDMVGLRTWTAGNGIRSNQERSRQGVLAHATAKPLGANTDTQAVLDYKYWWDAQGNLRLLQGKDRVSQYVYDWFDRLLVAQTQQTQERYYYDAQGRRVLSYEDGKTIKASYAGSAHVPNTSDHDAAGQPISQGGRQYSWDAGGRLKSVSQEGRTAEYRYDHRGLRIAKTVRTNGKSSSTYYLYDDDRNLLAELNEAGKIVRQYVFVARLPIAVVDGEHDSRDRYSSDNAIVQGVRDAGIAARSWFGDEDKITWLHTNHLEAPQVATDAQGGVVWRAEYAAFGKAAVIASKDGYSLNLRLPGQYEDAETGLYYNRQRYYDPAQGSYLSPDPLGTPDGPNRYSYVRFNPLRYVDPDGLVLFAFDGTGNSRDRNDPAMQGNGLTNVSRFFDQYADGNSHYISGVGTRDGDIDPAAYAKNTFLDWVTASDPLYMNDMGGNYSGPARIDRMMRYFEEEARANNNDSAMDIDIVGFSRGAAQARDFSNRLTTRSRAVTTKTGFNYNSSGMVQVSDRNGNIQDYYRFTTIYRDQSTGQLRASYRCQRVNFRFMGLWDTVLSTNWSGYAYKLAIPQEFKSVVQAVALNEYRSSSLGQFSYRNPKPYSQHWGGFPLESIGADRSTLDQVRIERGFLGAHADIGGGYPESEGQLADVALEWMIRQAKDAGVTMRPYTSQSRTTNPILHDQSNALRMGDPRLQPVVVINTDTASVLFQHIAEDRAVNGAVSGNTQRTMRFSNSSMQNVDTHQFIRYTPRDVERKGDGSALDSTKLVNRTGTVDMASYRNWLTQHGYTF